MRSWRIERTADRIAIIGVARIADGAPFWEQLLEAATPPATQLDLDLARTTHIDGALLGLVVEVRDRLRARGTPSDVVGASASLAPMVALYLESTQRAPHPRWAGRLERLGAYAARGWPAIREPTRFVGQLVDGLGHLLLRRTRSSWRQVPILLTRTGTDGAPIVFVLNFLVGFVIVFQSSRLLELYGANVYAADLVGIGALRALAPLMTAVILSGRSGAAFAAELGTMRVSEEIDALHAMGIPPVPYLVVPRVLALLIAAPILTLLADLAAVFGGLVVAYVSLDVTPRAYFGELRLVVVTSDLWTGLVKSAVFGAAIALIGCYQGLRTRGAAAGVGRSTTHAIVTCLFTLVVLDTLMTILFRGLGV